MATTRKIPTPRTPRKGATSRSERPPAQERPPVPFRVPDLRDPKVVADIRRQAKLMAQHPENDAIDDWIEQVVDWEAWK